MIFRHLGTQYSLHLLIQAGVHIPLGSHALRCLPHSEVLFLLQRTPFSCSIPAQWNFSWYLEIPGSKVAGAAWALKPHRTRFDTLISWAIVDTYLASQGLSCLVYKGLAWQWGEGNGAPLQFSCLENPMDTGAWWAAVHGVARSRTRLSDFIFNYHFHALEKEMATHSSVLAWRIPGTAEPGGLPSVGLHRAGHDWSDLAAAAWQWR